jgi:hypothetical protein
METHHTVTAARLGQRRAAFPGRHRSSHFYDLRRVRRRFGRVQPLVDDGFVHPGILRDLGNLAARSPRYQALGDVLRRTRCLYSYDHYINLLREAALCGCKVRTIDSAARWHDPRSCACPENIDWSKGRPDTYAAEFESHAFVAGFLAELERSGFL